MSRIEFYSHPEKTLAEHICGVLRHGLNSVSQMPPQISGSQGFKSLVELCCLCHDFGKFTTFFQDYLLRQKKQGSRHRHGFVSALFTAFQVKTNSIKFRKEIDGYLPLMSYLTVIHHHGNLTSLDDVVIRKSDIDNLEVADPNKQVNLRNLKAQLDDLLRNSSEIESIYQSICPSYDFSIKHFSESWQDLIYDLDFARHRFEFREKPENKRLVYIYLLLLYSILIDSDKKDAAGIEPDSERKSLSPSVVDGYRRNLSAVEPNESPMNRMREEIYQTISESIQNVGLNSHIMTITAPTGAGKTLSALSAAFRLRNIIEQEKGYSPRIIYSLPFISIINQNASVIDSMLASSIDEYNDTKYKYMLEHHCHSNVDFKKQDEYVDFDEAFLLLESWESEIIVTTFVQLLETMIGYRNRDMKKYHKLAGSIILLDEVQNIPVEYWQLVRDTIKLACEALSCYVILLTATKPLIFSEDECIELLKDHPRYFSSLHRTRIVPDMRPILLDELIERFSEIYDEDLSFMVVLNTIRSSVYVYERIKKLRESEKISSPIFYLSSNVIHKHREIRIKEILDSFKQGEKPVLVSTQVVEAGVDLDFDRVIRDLGPIDSVVQVAGRCNRSAKRPLSEVLVFNVVNERGQRLSSYVYGKISANASESALSKGPYDEEEYYKLVDNFFQCIKNSESPKISNDIYSAMTELRFYSDRQVSVSDFKVIESLPYHVDVFVQTDQEAVEIWEYYLNEVLKERKIEKKISNFAKIRSKFQAHIISVPKDLVKELVQVHENFFLIPIEAIDRYYDPDIGFKRELDDSTWIL